MKKMSVLFLTLILELFLSACSLGGNGMIMDNDQKIANDKFEEIIEVIQSQNSDMLTALFSKESIDNEETFNNSVEKLFEYFTGTVESYDDWGACHVETTKEDDQILQIMESTYDVKTTECEYRFAVRYIAKDTVNSDNVGVQSLYVIRMQDDIYTEYAYWGDGKYTPGINIGIPNAE